jgi:hypothetical protein
VKVNALFVKDLPDGGKVGSTRPVRITVDHSPSHEFRVGFFEGEVDGSTAMWRAAGWLASVVAAGFVDMDLANTRVSFDVGGEIGGPSVGGLMTVGLVAALRGDQVRDDAAMTGTINPDGSIGVVGGVPHKIEAAAKAGKKLVVIPAGFRVMRDENLKKEVDLFEHGKKHGVEVREVSDLFAAYQLMTGKELPRLAPALAPEIGEDKAYERIRNRTREWLAHYQKAQEACAKLPDASKGKSHESAVAEARKAADLAERLLKEGVAGAACAKAQEATFLISNALLRAELLGLYQKLGKIKGRETALASLQASLELRQKEIPGLAQRFGKMQPKTLSEACALLSAWTTLVESATLANLAEERLRKAAAAKEPDTLIGVAASFLDLSTHLDRVAREHLDLDPDLGGPALPAKARVDLVASFYRHVARANLNYVDAHLDEEAGPQGKRLEEFRRLALDKDPLFAVAWNAQGPARTLEKILAGSPGADFGRLGAALTVYSYSSSVVAKRTSLLCKLGEHGEVTAVLFERNLLNMIDLADAQARRSIAFLRQRKVDATPLIIAYESARLQRDSALEDKFSALQGFWEIHAQARALAYLGGLTRQDPDTEPKP